MALLLHASWRPVGEMRVGCLGTRLEELAEQRGGLEGCKPHRKEDGGPYNLGVVESSRLVKRFHSRLAGPPSEGVPSPFVPCACERSRLCSPSPSPTHVSNGESQHLRRQILTRALRMSVYFRSTYYYCVAADPPDVTFSTLSLLAAASIIISTLSLRPSLIDLDLHRQC